MFIRFDLTKLTVQLVSELRRLVAFRQSSWREKNVAPVLPSEKKTQNRPMLNLQRPIRAFVKLTEPESSLLKRSFDQTPTS